MTAARHTPHCRPALLTTDAPAPSRGVCQSVVGERDRRPDPITRPVAGDRGNAGSVAATAAVSSAAEPIAKPAEGVTANLREGRQPYQKLGIAAKERVARERQRDTALRCPWCDGQLMPDQLAGHMSMRCSRQRPQPSAAARWLNRAAALNYATASTLDRWVARGLVRASSHGDGERYLERDVAMATAWSRALECL